MPIDPDKLLRFAIPPVRERVTPRDAAFYALSVGFGQDPLDPRQLRFVDPVAGPAPVPTMPLIMAHPGFWLGHPDSGVDPVAVLHASQMVEVLDTIPIDGEVESRTWITDLVDKGPGKPALIYSVTTLSDAAGRKFARLERTIFVRGGGGFGGSSGVKSPDIGVPATEPDAVVDLQTRPEQALFYRLNGDLNPLHSDPAVAAKAGFHTPILHGLCTMGVVAHALLRGALDYRAVDLRSISLRFASPVLPGETIRTEIWRNGAFRAKVVERDIVIADQGHFTTSSTRPQAA